MLLPSTGRFLWLKADTLALANGAPVAAWTDSSGTGNNAAQTTSGARPAFVTNAVAGKPAVRFINGKSLLTPSIPAKSALTILMYLVSSNSAAGYLVLATDGSHGIIQGYTIGKYEYFSSPRTVIGDISTTNYQFIYSRVGTSIEGAWQIGLDTAFDLAEIVAYDRVLTNQELIDAADYFADKYDSNLPSDVINLNASNVTQSTADLNWDDATDNRTVADYKLERATDSLFTQNVVSADLGSTVSAKTVTGLSPIKYYFRVKAKDGAGNYSLNWSNVAEVEYVPMQLLRWSQPIIVGGLSSVISATGRIEIAANTAGVNLGSGKRLDARWYMPGYGSGKDNTYELIISNISTYTRPADDAKVLDFLLAQREGANVKLHDGRILPPDSSVEANVYIAKLAAGTAYLGSAVIDGAIILTASISWAQVGALQTTNYISDTSGFKITDDVVEFNNLLRAKGYDIAAAALRALSGLDVFGRLRGRDLGPVPTNRISAQVHSPFAVQDGFIRTRINGGVAGKNTESGANADSVEHAIVEIFNQFGESVVVASEDWKGYPNSKICEILHESKYAYPEQAYYKIQVINLSGQINDPVYLKNNVVSTAKPAALIRANCPLELSGTPLSASSVRFTFQFSFPGGATVKLQRRTIGTLAWADHQSGVSANQFDSENLPQNTNLEYRLVSSANSAYVSNIARVATYAQAIAPPARPAPTSLSVTKDSANPTSKVNATWVRTATDNTGVQIRKNGDNNNLISLAANDEAESFASIAEGATTTIEVRNTWDTGTPNSAWTEAKSATTDVTPPAELEPIMDSVSYSTATQKSTVNFTPRSGSGNFTVQKSENGEYGSYSDVSTAVSGSPYETPTESQGTSDRVIWYRVKRNNINGYSNAKSVTIPALDAETSPTALQVYQDGGGTIYVSWTNRGSQGTKIVERRRGIVGGWSMVINASPEQTSDLDTLPIAQKGTHNYRISDSTIPGVYATTSAFLDTYSGGVV